MQDDDLLIKCVGWFINHLTITCCVVMLSSSRPAVLSLSEEYHFEHVALKSPMTIEQVGC